FLDAGGRWGIGSDSHISVSPVEELRWLEYGQRLLRQRRNIAVSAAAPSVGAALLRGVLDSAANATGFPAMDDAVVLDAASPLLAGATDADVVDRWIFSGNRPAVRDVHVAGRQVVAGGVHMDHEATLVR